MAKITTYDYNRAENTLTVTYESGTVRKYSVDCTPKATQTFIMKDIVNSILSEYRQKFLDRKAEIFPLIRFNEEIGRENKITLVRTNEEVAREFTFICAKLNYISEFSSLSLISFVSTLSRYYIALKDDALSEELPEYCSPRRHESLKNDYNFFSELVERFRIPADDCSFIFTLEHLLSVAFPDREYDEPETEEATPEVSSPVEEPEQSDDLPEIASAEMSSYPLDVPYDMRVKSLCRKCKHLESCFNDDRSKVLEDVYRYEPCDEVCGECTLCCKRFEKKTTSLSAVDRKNDDLPF